MTLRPNRTTLVAEARAGWMKLLQTVTVAANQASAEQAMQTCIDEVCAYTGWPVGHVYLRDVDKPNELVPTAIWSTTTDDRFWTLKHVTANTRMPSGIGLPGRVLASGHAAWITDLGKDGNFPRIHDNIGVKAGFAFPVLSGTDVVGVLEFFSEAAVEPDAEMLDVMTHVGTQLGRALERQRAEESLRASEEQKRLIIEAAYDAFVAIDSGGTVISWNPQAEATFGWSAREAVGQPLGSLIVPPEHREAHERGLRRFLQTGEGPVLRKRIEISALHRSGREFPIELTISPVRFRNSYIFSAFIHDITERKEAEERLRHAVTHDVLTNLPNRALLHDRLSQDLARAQWQNKTVAVLFIDIDRFKLINESLGHRAGDSLLVSVAERLRGCVREGDTVARLGADEFAIVLADVADPQDVVQITKKVRAAFDHSFPVLEQSLFVTASVGISLFPADGADPETLVKHADIAMYRAKEHGRDHEQYYSPAMNARASERLAMENGLRGALERGELVLHYQPIVNLTSCEIVGMEALIRWNHPSLGLIYPGDFIPLAEQTGLIVPIGHWVIRTACAQGKAWQEAGLPPVRMAINISARQFFDRNLVPSIAEVLRTTGLDPRWLELELTESVIMTNANNGFERLRELHELGIEMSIDDFGTGYSSLSYLKKFPIGTLKIDQSFVRNIATDAEDAAIVTAIITMAHSLKLKVISEAVETQEQLAFLRTLGCDEWQGYLFSRPLPPDQIKKVVTRGGNGS